MRAFWAKHASEGVPETGFETLAAEVSGVDLGDFFNRMIRGTDDPPLAALFESVGLTLRFHASVPKADSSAPQYLPALGLRVRAGERSAEVINVLDGSAAQDAGVSAGDEIVAVNGVRLNRASLVSLLGGEATNRQFELALFRRDELIAATLVGRAAVADRATLSDAGEVDLAQRAACQAWLASRA
ncbi:MAG: PDZ domain-containing protein [Pseudomonadota bacterium]